MNEVKPDISVTKRLSINKLKAAQPKTVNLSQEELVKCGSLSEGSLLPLVIEANLKNLNLADWIAGNLNFIAPHLFKHGGLLFRGFNLNGLTDFDEFLAATKVELMHYLESATPRTALKDRIYTSTEYPPSQSIALHNELSTSTTFPMKIWFLCIEPAEEGGETPIADVRKVFARLDPVIRDRFMQKGWMLVRNYGEGFGIPWQTSFHTSEKSVVEEYCCAGNIEFEWKPDDQLRTRQVRTAVARHPHTGELVWFNHVAFWHISSLEANVREAMSATFREEDLPYNTYYGDGSPIEDSVVGELREAYRQEQIVFPWQKGDLLMLDNMLVAHGRNPFAGRRKILAAMGEPSSYRGV